ncbi:unnamed protein product (macronuclear) [Paramecium tetraurelia]|uniref:RING-type domain-containing protein n=1 Tax=Paramecium tetraurelia TaxID=5888 RepID=A0DM54_PARTE|nr:uncharacterized protein GSPATT00018339001 [Paramecium tetraurelia]CAK84121.1 unnamed protein product [Paramecium tetraurelia]|eukprot:XP_001451518.1 hypothetical protein (macronuclear) [Paramecium tetraurelia strain d4-2]
MSLKSNPYIQTLINFINQPEKIVENSERFDELITRLCQQEIDPQIEYDGSNFCCHCLEFLVENNYKNLPCGHNVHTECFKTYLSEQPFYIESIDTYSCCKESETCSQVLITDEVSKYILGGEEFNNLRNLYTLILNRYVMDQNDNDDPFDIDELQNENGKQAENQSLNDYDVAKQIEQQEQVEKRQNYKRATFDCAICFENYDLEQEAITLDCDHRFCRQCIKEQIYNQMDLGNFKESDLVCPLCNHPINFYIIQNCTPDVSAKINDLRTQNLKIDSKYEKVVVCPGRGCPASYIISIYLEFPTCTNCKLQFCANGCDKAHQGMTCEQFKQKTRAKQEKGLVNCPKCKVQIFKDGGCNHMTCRCKHEFCYVCSKPYKPKRECNCPQMTTIERFFDRVKGFIGSK